MPWKGFEVVDFWRTNAPRGVLPAEANQRVDFGLFMQRVGVCCFHQYPESDSATALGHTPWNSLSNGRPTIAFSISGFCCQDPGVKLLSEFRLFVLAFLLSMLRNRRTGLWPTVRRSTPYCLYFLDVLLNINSLIKHWNRSQREQWRFIVDG